MDERSNLCCVCTSFPLSRGCAKNSLWITCLVFIFCPPRLQVALWPLTSRRQQDCPPEEGLRVQSRFLPQHRHLEIQRRVQARHWPGVDHWIVVSRSRQGPSHSQKRMRCQTQMRARLDKVSMPLCRIASCLAAGTALFSAKILIAV